MNRTYDSAKVAGEAYATPWSDPRKGKPYVAVLEGIDPDAPGGLRRRFLGCLEWGKKNCRAVVAVEEVKQLPDGTVLEAREAPSWKNDWRRYYVVSLGSPFMLKGKAEAMRVLKGLPWEDSSPAGTTEDVPADQLPPPKLIGRHIVALR